MKRKLTMTLAIILATSIFTGCEQDKVDTSQLVTEETIDQIYPSLPNDNSAGVDDVGSYVGELDEKEQTSDLTKEIQGKTPEEISQMIEDGTFVPISEPQTTVVRLDSTDFTPIPTTVDPPVDIPTQGAVLVPTTVDPPVDTPTQGAVLVPTTVDPPTVVTTPEYPTANVDYNLTLTAGENTVIENVSVSVQMKQPLQDGAVPTTNGWYVPGEIVTNLVSANKTQTFSVEDWRTTLRPRYETIITINYGKPFSISTDLIDRIPSVNGVVEVYVSQLYIDDNDGSADINITLTDETGLW